jgi:hypothetical protein
MAFATHSRSAEVGGRAERLAREIGAVEAADEIAGAKLAALGN